MSTRVRSTNITKKTRWHLFRVILNISGETQTSLRSSGPLVRPPFFLGGNRDSKDKIYSVQGLSSSRPLSSYFFHSAELVDDVYKAVNPVLKQQHT